MQRHMGGEGIMGLGGGTVSKESVKRLDMAEEMCREGKPFEAMGHLKFAMRDSRNLDAWILFAHLFPVQEKAIHILEIAEKRGRKQLEEDFGSNCFTQTHAQGGGRVEQFWSLLETRPYMRLLSALVDMNTENKEYSAAADTIIEMLRLCPPDNQGQRYRLPALLVLANRCQEALSYAQMWCRNDGAHPSTRTTPIKTPLTAAEVRKYTAHKSTKSEHYYSGALAAFRVWGDCKLARQYLYIGATLNPYIITKILAKVKKPAHFKTRNRVENSLEDANDYLWLAQDAWMVADVWAWANDCEDVKQVVLRKCSLEGCGRREKQVAEFKRCSGCHMAFYCTGGCQKLHWKSHKPVCKKHQEDKNWEKLLLLPHPTSSVTIPL